MAHLRELEFIKEDFIGEGLCEGQTEGEGWCFTGKVGVDGVFGNGVTLGLIYEEESGWRSSMMKGVSDVPHRQR